MYHVQTMPTVARREHLIPLGLELQMAVRYHVGAGPKTRSYATALTSPQPYLCFPKAPLLAHELGRTLEMDFKGRELSLRLCP